MKIKTLIISAASFGLVAGSALAQMQPIPNPPEAPAKHVTHHKKTHTKHHPVSAKAAVKEDASNADKAAKTPAAKSAMPPGPVNPMPPKK